MFLIDLFLLLTGITHPTLTVSINSGLMFAEAKAALFEMVCKSQALVFTNFPPYVPIAVRLAATITISKNYISHLDIWFILY